MRSGGFCMSHKRGEEASKTPKDEQRTPPELFRKLNERFHFDIDAAATKDNALCKSYFSKDGYNALEHPWYVKTYDGKWATIFCNPPYSNGLVEKFLQQGYIASLRGNVVVFLITCDVSPRYYRICHKAAEWIAIDGRVDFCHEDGTPIKGSAAFGSNVIVFDSKQFKEQERKTIVTRMAWK